MPPKNKEERAAARAERKAKKDGSGASTPAGKSMDSLSAAAEKMKLDNNRSATGVLTSQKDSRDIKVFFTFFLFFFLIDGLPRRSMGT